MGNDVPVAGTAHHDGDSPHGCQVQLTMMETHLVDASVQVTMIETHLVGASVCNKQHTVLVNIYILPFCSLSSGLVTIDPAQL